MALQYLIFQYLFLVFEISAKLKLGFQPNKKITFQLFTGKSIREEVPGLCIGTALLWKASAVRCLGVLHLVLTEEGSCCSPLPYYLNAGRRVMGFFYPCPFADIHTLHSFHSFIS